MNRPNIEKAYDFSNKSISRIYITGGGYVRREFKGASPTSMFGWDEFSWASSPTRSSDYFAMTNIDQKKVGLIPRCEINIKYLNYEDYVALRRIFKERHFLVEFFNADDMKWVTRDMYVTENTKSRFYTLDQKLIGVLDMSIKLVGTNNDVADTVGKDGKFVVKQLKVQYDGASEYNIESPYGSQVTLSGDQNEIFASSSHHLAGWITKNSQGVTTGRYLPKQSITLWKDLYLYPVYENGTN